jgi:hypothetical protein
MDFDKLVVEFGRKKNSDKPLPIEQALLLAEFAEYLKEAQHRAQPDTCPACGYALVDGVCNNGGCAQWQVRQIPGADVFHRARGVIPWKDGDELPEDTIRRLRGDSDTS